MIKEGQEIQVQEGLDGRQIKLLLKLLLKQVDSLQEEVKLLRGLVRVQEESLEGYRKMMEGLIKKVMDAPVPDQRGET